MSSNRDLLQLDTRKFEPVDSIGDFPTLAFPIGLTELLKARNYAEELQRDAWDFAVEINRLIKYGLSRSDLRWLVCKGFITHRREMTGRGGNQRRFRESGELNFTRRTCFIITDAGVEHTRGLAFWPELSAASATGPTPLSGNGNRPAGNATIRSHHDVVHLVSKRTSGGPRAMAEQQFPRWDPEGRVLFFNGQIVKRFKWQALNQEKVLAAFEEEQWPTRIDDPLTPQAEQEPKRRLSDTIKCLNRKQTSQLLHFRGDGTGEGVIWELV